MKSAGMFQSESLQREREILSALSSRHIVSYKGWDLTLEGAELIYNLFMECCPRGTIRDAIDRRGGRLPEPEIVHYTWQILAGMEHLHSRGILHCDIKSENILITEEDGVKISDFGCARRIVDPAAPIGGTPIFMAPEVARGEEQGCSADVWSLGCTVIEMSTGKTPWLERGDPFKLMYRIAYSAQLPETPSGLSDEAKDFLSKCLRRDPRERWTVTQLRRHPFLARSSSPVSKQSEELKSCSPTCVLDRGFWSWSPEDSGPDYVRMRNSAADPIRQLSVRSGRPDWMWEEDWVNVRENPVEQGRQANGDLCGPGSSCGHDRNLQRVIRTFR